MYALLNSLYLLLYVETDLFQQARKTYTKFNFCNEYLMLIACDKLAANF